MKNEVEAAHIIHIVPTQPPAEVQNGSLSFSFCMKQSEMVFASDAN